MADDTDRQTRIRDALRGPWVAIIRVGTVAVLDTHCLTTYVTPGLYSCRDLYVEILRGAATPKFVGDTLFVPTTCKTDDVITMACRDLKDDDVDGVAARYAQAVAMAAGLNEASTRHDHAANYITGVTDQLAAAVAAGDHRAALAIVDRVDDDGHTAAADILEDALHRTSLAGQLAPAEPQADGDTITPNNVRCSHHMPAVPKRGDVPDEDHAPWRVVSVEPNGNHPADGGGFVPSYVVHVTSSEHPHT